jgi:hypothetical protein
MFTIVEGTVETTREGDLRQAAADVPARIFAKTCRCCSAAAPNSRPGAVTWSGQRRRSTTHVAPVNDVLRRHTLTPGGTASRPGDTAVVADCQLASDSISRLSSSRSFRFARRMARAITGAATLANPDGSPLFRSVMRVAASASSSHV